MKLQDLLSIKSEKQFKDICKTYLCLLGSGASRDVYKLNSKQIIKVAKNDFGYIQNATEVKLFNTYKDLNLFNEIIQYSKYYLWVIQPLVTPLNKDDILFKQIVDVVDHIKNFKEYFNTDACMQKLYKFLIENEWKYLQDIAKHDNWGIINNELKLIDYGIDNKVYNEYFVK
jgi:hypothetical protein